jgi:hypothetical protein
MLPLYFPLLGAKRRFRKVWQLPFGKCPWSFCALILSIQVSDTLTTSHGHPIDDKANTMTIGERGPVPIQDFTFLDEMAHFDRERIPERVVHAKGAGWLPYDRLSSGP